MTTRKTHPGYGTPQWLPFGKQGQLGLSSSLLTDWPPRTAECPQHLPPGPWESSLCLEKIMKRVGMGGGTAEAV